MAAKRKSTSRTVAKRKLAQKRQTSRRTPAKKRATRKQQTNRWSAEVTEHSNALDLDPGVFTWKNPARIAASLKHSAVKSRRRKSSPYRSALSMLTFHINRSGKSLAAGQKAVLQKAKDELRKSFGRE